LITANNMFALRVDNITKATAFYNSYEGLANDKKEAEIKKDYEKIVELYADAVCAPSCTVEEYTSYLNNYLVYYLSVSGEDTGLSLYQATEDADGKTTWNAFEYTVYTN